jgi:hypothetical protein
MYLMLEDFSSGAAWRETDEDRTDYRTLISDLLTGQYDHPLRVVAFNPLEGWSRDASEDVAHELEQRVAEGHEVTEPVREFIEDLPSGVDDPGKALGPVKCAPAEQPHAVTVALHAKAIAVVFYFVDPVRAAGHGFAGGRQAELNLGHGRHLCPGCRNASARVWKVLIR